MPASLSPAVLHTLRGADLRVLTTCRQLLGPTPAVPVARGLSSFGEHARGWVLLGAAGWASGRRRREWAVGAGAAVLAHASAVALKRVVRRPRPLVEAVPPLERTHSLLSFPSAHATSTAAAAVGFAPLLGARAGVTALGAMALARVLLGVHWPSDVLAGAALGAGVGSGVQWAADRRWPA